MNQSERPRFFEGQYLGAADLAAAVDYGRAQAARVVLGAHTWGIAIGLDLVERPLASGDIDVTVAPGLAWDGYARPVVVLAPAKLTTDRFANFQADTPPDGLLVKVWLRYDEAATSGPAQGFQNCRVDDQNARIVESFVIGVGDPATGPQGTLSIAGRSVDAVNARAAFNPGAPSVYDELIPYQAFPDGKLPQWWIPIGYVRWFKQSGQPGRLIARNDKGTPPDSDQIRAVRPYIGAVAETVDAADGVIRLRDRWSDPAKSFFQPPRVTIDKNNPPVNDLVWIEGHLRVLGDARIAGGKLEFRDQAGSDGKVPLAIRRLDPSPQGGKDLQVLIGADGNPSGKNGLAVGPVKLDTTTGALGDMTKCLVVRDNGNVGIAVEAPTQLLTLGGDKSTRLELGKISASLPWGSNAPAKAGDGSFAVNQQSNGSGNPGADFALMRDQKLRVVLFDANTQISSQSGGSVILSVNAGETGEQEAARVSAAGNVGIGTQSPQASLDVNGDLALNHVGPGGARPLPVGATLMWNDGTWLRLNQNRDFGKPIFGVHTPGIFAPGSLNVGGASNWGDPGFGNAWFLHNVGIGTTTPVAPLDVAGRIMRQGQDFSKTGIATNDDLVIVPWGTRAEWNIFVSPRSMGQEEPGSEFDDAMLMLECFAFAEPATADRWRIRCRYKFRFTNGDGVGDGQWFPGQANWLLVPL